MTNDSPIPGWLDAEGAPVSYSQISAEIDKGATVLVEHVTALAASWEADHDATALFEGIGALVNTLAGYSMPLVGALVRADEVSAYIEAQAALFVVPDTIPAEEV